jgi:hypothetical protein
MAITEQDQWPAEVSVFKTLKEGAVRRFTIRSGDKVLMLRWKSKWWTVPTMDEVGRWTFDSVCETPDGDIVEPDAPDSWLHLLKLV